MEPRPQRSRRAPGTGQGQQHAATPAGRPHSPQPGYPGGSPDAYAEDAEPQTYIAPPRTEYDYSPLDLAPPGQRRRRQFVAAAIGGLTVLLLVAVGVLAFLLFHDDGEKPQSNLQAAQTELNNAQATIDGQATILANAAATETATVAVTNESQDATKPATATDEASGARSTDGATDPAGAAATGEDAQATGGATEESTGGTQADGSAPSVAALEALLPAAGTVPEALDSESDSNLDLQAVVDALGGSRTAEQNLEQWGWSGNVGRTYTPSDPTVLDANALDFFSVSVHGFADAASAQEALTYFSDVLISIDGSYEEVDTTAIGDSARMLVSTDDAGAASVALYVQQGNVLYRFGGHAAADGDPAGDVQSLAEATLPAGE